jgi:hypothetical protein
MEHSQFAEQDAHGPAIDHDVVGYECQEVTLFVYPQQRCPKQRTLC